MRRMRSCKKNWKYQNSNFQKLKKDIIKATFKIYLASQGEAFVLPIFAQ